MWVISILVLCLLVWLMELLALTGGVATSDPSFSLNPCFRHAKLTATLWVIAACECWDGKGISEWKAPITATRMVLHNWLNSVFFKGPSVFCSLTYCAPVQSGSWLRDTEFPGPRCSQTHKPKYWLFKADDTVNMGKVRQLCICFSPSRMFLQSIGQCKFALI